MHAHEHRAQIKLLIVDDQPAFLQLVREILEGHPRFRIVGEASDGPTAIEMAEELFPDMVLIDIEMPGQDGFRAAARIVARFPAVKVFSMSAYQESAYRTEGLRVGIADFIPKFELTAQRLEQAWDAAQRPAPPRDLGHGESPNKGRPA